MKTLLKIIIPLLLIAAGLFGFKALKSSAPEAKSKKAPTIVPEAEFIEVSPTSHQPPIRSFGTVDPYFETTLTALLTGRIVDISDNFRVGQIVKKEEVLLRIDRTDFQSALATQQSTLANAERALAEEKIQAKQAAADWKASGRDLSTASPFVLRAPQRAAAEASIEAAKAAVDKAIADLARTEIRAPFDAIVTTRSASVGNLATPQNSLGTLVATERVEVSLPLTAEQLKRINLPTVDKEGPAITLQTPLHPDVTWKGQITRVSPSVSRDQVVTVIAEVSSPYDSEPSLSIGTFVNVAIDGQPIENSYEVPEAILVNDSFIWALDDKDSLVKIGATRLQSDKNNIYIRLGEPALEPPLRLITRPLTTFKEGMTVTPTP